MIDCAASGEPLITSMSPQIDPHPTTLEETLIKKLVGPPKHHTAWEVHKPSHRLRLILHYTHFGDVVYLAVAVTQRETRIKEIVS